MLGHSWSADNNYIFGACADNQVKMWDIGANAVTQVGVHDSCAKDVHWCPQNNILISTGWDGHVKFWDLKQSSPIFDINLEPMKIWSSSYVYPLLVGAFSDNSIFVFNMDDITGKQSVQPNIVVPSPLKFQTRSVEAFPNARGYAVTSIEGR